MNASDLLDLLIRPEWMQDAACRGVDPELFFPPQGGSVAAPKAVCTECPVRVECFDYGASERFGVWGGATERERRRIRHGELVAV